jgi:hypothetical protein
MFACKTVAPDRCSTDQPERRRDCVSLDPSLLYSSTLGHALFYVSEDSQLVKTVVDSRKAFDCL